MKNIFEQYLGTITRGNIHYRQRLLEFIGVMISALSLKAIFLLIGAKNSGKSTFIRLVSLLIGRDCVQEINSLNDLSANKWLVGDLVGKKLCVCSEQPKISLTHNTVAILKRLTGGDLIQGERKYQDPFYFPNEASLLVASNHKLILPDKEDDAFASRIKIAPFMHSLSTAEQIPDFEKTLILESGYIVYHACEALKRLIDNNFEFTPIDDLDTDWRSTPDQDLVERFINECCILDPDSRETTDDLYTELSIYYDGEPPMSKAIFGRYLSQTLGLKPWKSSTHRGFFGIRLIRSTDDT